MKKLILTALTLTLACSKSPFGGQETAIVVLNTTAQPELNITTKVDTQYDIPTTVADYTVKITNTYDNSVAIDGVSLNDNAEIEVPKGNYKAELKSLPAANATFEQPMYAGSATFTAATGKKSTVDITTKLACAIVDVNFSDNIKSAFSSYRISIKGNGDDKLVFDSSTDNKLGYFSTPLTKLTYKIEVVTNQGFSYSSEGATENLKSGDLLQMNLDIADAPADNEEPLVIELLLQQQLNEIEKEFSFGATFESSGAPTITGHKIELTKPINVNYKSNISPVKIDLNTPGKLDKILFLFNIDQTSIAGFEKVAVVDMMNSDMRSALKVSFDDNSGNMNDLESVLDLTQFVNLLPGSDESSELFRMSIGLLDKNGQYSVREITFNVYGKPINTGDAQANWLRRSGDMNYVNLVFNGKYNTENAPENLRFNYRLVGETDWKVVDALIGANKTVSATIPITINDNGAKYEYQLFNNDNVGNILVLNVPFYSIIPNMSLDSWTGGTYSNPVNWSSPNANAVVDKVITTTEAEGWNGTGKSARIESQFVVGNFASGGLFSGGMEVVMPPSAYKSAQVGIPFNGRPKKMIVSFKYTSKKIDNYADGGATGNNAVNGGDDMCEIAIKLEKWDGYEYKIRWKDGFYGNPGTGGYKDSKGDPVHPRLAQVVDYDGNSAGTFSQNIRAKIAVGYGQITSYDQPTWKRVEIPITYSQDVTPDHVIITAVSSAWGGYMTGAKGSVLYVDDFEFVY